MTSPADTTPLREALELFMAAMDRNGNWDDGCFYYSGRSASELQRPIELARASLASEPVAGTAFCPECDRAGIANCAHFDTCGNVMEAPPAPAGREAELAAEVKRLRDGLQSIVDLKNPLPRAAVREACAEILASGPALSPQAGATTASAPEAVAWLYEVPMGGDRWSQRYSDTRPADSQYHRNIRPLYLTPPSPGAADRAAVVERALRDEIFCLRCIVTDVRIMANAGHFKEHDGEPWLKRARNIDLHHDPVATAIRALAPANTGETGR